MATSLLTTGKERLKEYHIIKKIGKGSYGDVFLVKKKRDKKQFVMKQIRLSTANVKEQCAATQEAELLSQLKHPNIVSYHESFHDSTDGILHIVMGYCEGGDLCSRLRALNGNILSEDKVVEWFVQIALALQYLHERLIMHRDLKTQNIFISKHDVIKVGDLGIARVLEGSLDLAHTVVGTPYYMSPELFANKPYNFKSDVWALGCCVYEMATLNHAFTAKNISALMYKILQGKVPPLPLCFTRDLNNLVCKMLSLEAGHRPSVYQILRTEFVRYHIKRFLDKATKRKSSKQSTGCNKDTTGCNKDTTGCNKDTTTGCNKDAITGCNKDTKTGRQKEHIPEQSPCSPFLKPLQINKQHKPSPELSTAREKRRRSKQEATKNRLQTGNKDSPITGKRQDGEGRHISGKGEHDGEDRPISGKEEHDKEDRPISGKGDEQDGGEEEEVLSLMNTTLLQLPEPHPQNNKGITPTIGESRDWKMEEIKRYCINGLGNEIVMKALHILDSDTDNIEDKMADLLGQAQYNEYFVLLQKMKLYTQTTQ